MFKKINRIATKVFASKSEAEGVAKFNSKTDTITNFTKDANEIMNADYEKGLEVLDAIDGGLFTEVLNGIFYVIDSKIAYLNQAGIPEYAMDEVYYKNCLTRIGSKLYRFKVDNPFDNAGIEVSDSRFWEEIINFEDTSAFFKKVIDDNYNYVYEKIFNSFVKDKHRYYSEVKTLIRDDLTLTIREDQALLNLMEDKVVRSHKIKERIEDVVLGNPQLSGKIIADLIRELNKEDEYNALIIALKQVLLNKGGIIADLKKEIFKAKIGCMEIFLVDPNDTPEGYLYCDGKAYKKKKYPDLYKVIGNRFERHYSGSSSMLKDEFAVPDMRNETTRGVGNKNSILGAKQSDAIEYHTHAYETSKEEGYTGNNGWGFAVSGLKKSTIKTYKTNYGNTTSGTFATETRMRNVAVNYFIKY